jgi:hypothetical protein
MSGQHREPSPPILVYVMLGAGLGLVISMCVLLSAIIFR